MGVFKHVSRSIVFDEDDNLSCLSKQKVVSPLGNGKVISFKTVDMSKDKRYAPSKDEMDLEAQLAAGVKPKQINVHGLLTDPEDNVAAAAAAIDNVFNSKDDSKDDSKTDVIDFTDDVKS